VDNKKIWDLDPELYSEILNQNSHTDLRQNVIKWFFDQAPPLQKISAKSAHNLLKYTAKCQFIPYLLMVKNPGK